MAQSINKLKYFFSKLVYSLLGPVVFTYIVLRHVFMKIAIENLA
jgi:hypothetical protein